MVSLLIKYYRIFSFSESYKEAENKCLLATKLSDLDSDRDFLYYQKKDKFFEKFILHLKKKERMMCYYQSHLFQIMSVNHQQVVMVSFMLLFNR